MSRVVHFEIHAADPERAMAFYRKLFNWEFTRWHGPMDYWLIRTGEAPAPGIDGGLVRRMGGLPALGAAVNAFICTVDVSDLDGALGRVEAAGGSHAHPKMPIPGVGWLAYVKDPEGNILGLMQNDPAAA